MERGCGKLLSRTRILLEADHGAGGSGWGDATIATVLDIHVHTVHRIRRQVVTDGLPATLAPKRPDRVYARAFDGRQEAHLTALAYSVPPAGHARWSLRLLADKVVRLDVVDAISYETVRRTL